MLGKWSYYVSSSAFVCVVREAIRSGPRSEQIRGEYSVQSQLHRVRCSTIITQWLNPKVTGL
jgi:hypothetical protein